MSSLQLMKEQNFTGSDLGMYFSGDHLFEHGDHFFPERAKKLLAFEGVMKRPLVRNSEPRTLKSLF